MVVERVPFPQKSCVRAIVRGRPRSDERRPHQTSAFGTRLIARTWKEKTPWDFFGNADD